MSDYSAPLDEIRFTLSHVVDLQGLTKLAAFDQLDPETIGGVLEENARFMEQLVAPLNRVGDQQASRWDGGSVTTPAGFREAYKQYVAAGWGGVPFPEDHGGGGFPWLVGIAMQEIMCSANLSFSLCPLLTQGAIDMLLHHGSEEQQLRYLDKMVTGEWSGTMNLTEPQAGSDVGALTTKAVPGEDGTWLISGQKIFITYGEHDMSDNIIHLVLARVPDAPPGTKGISCFIVPKFLVDEAGKPAERNSLECVSIEHKLGIHASPTCVMAYDKAVGYLIGEANQGMRYMFTMMNNARLSVGLQGLGVGEPAYQQALAYAHERKQGRAPGASRRHGQSLIIDLPDVRRMLLTMRAINEAMRALIYLNAETIDLATHHPDETVREHNAELTELLTPISKGWCTDMGVEVASLAIQVYGGMGYIEETGVAQYYRDARIAPIYEGTNGIQALDLVGRKLPLRAGGVVTDYLAGIERTADEVGKADDALAPLGERLREAHGAYKEATDWLMAKGLEDPTNAMAGATPYLRMSGIVTGGWLLARSAMAAQQLLDDGSSEFATEFLEQKIVTARFYCEQLLPQAAGLLPAITAGPADLTAAVL